MNSAILNDKDAQLGDYRFRISQEYTTVVWYLTERCNFSCSYCVGWHDGGRDCLTDRYAAEKIVEDFRCLQDRSGNRLYIWLTGGEPSLVTDFPKLIKLLTKDMDIELQTNLCTKYIKDFANNADPKRVGQIMATYHSEILDKNDFLKKLYFENFRYLTAMGFNVVFKIIALPEEIPYLKEKLAWLKAQLPDGAKILVQPFIAGDSGPKRHPMGYPYIYTDEEKRTLQEVVQTRRSEILDYINGAGWFRGMRCDAGRGFIALNKNGDLFRCVADMVSRRGSLGNLVKRDTHLLKAPKPCRLPHCGSPFWSLWYGVNPWDYMNKRREDCPYNRFSQMRLNENKSAKRGTKKKFFFMPLFISNRRAYSVINRILNDRLTYLGPLALIDLYKSVSELKQRKKEGIIVEAGCALGGSALVMASSKEKGRPFFIYDVFEMIPPPSQRDSGEAHARYRTISSGKSSGINGNRYYGYEEDLLEKVRQTFSEYNLEPSENNIYLIKGLFKDTLFVNEPVALAHIDCDWYESVMVCLKRITPHLVKGGILIIDDYYTWEGCRRAVDVYFSDEKKRFEFYKKGRLYIVRK